MSEFFIELFSEEIPANLQNKTRQDFFQNLKEFLENIANKCMPPDLINEKS